MSQSKAASPATLSKEAELTLTQHYLEGLQANGGVPKDCTAPSRERRKYLRDCIATFHTVPTEQLPADMAIMKRKLSDVKGALAELNATPSDQLPPHLREMKLEMRMYMAKDPFAPPRVERRMNEALRAAGEPEIQLPYSHHWDYMQDPPARVRNEAIGDLDEAVRRANEQLEDLSKRKPRLYAVVIGYWTEFVAHENKIPEVYGGSRLAT